MFGFRLPSVVLTHPTFPIPIWSTLQVRNHLHQQQPILLDLVIDLETRVAGQRILVQATLTLASSNLRSLRCRAYTMR